MARIILASQSPRRREIMKLVGLDFEVIPSDCEEIITTTDPAEIVCELSRQKAEDVANKIISSSGSCFDKVDSSASDSFMSNVEFDLDHAEAFNISDDYDHSKAGFANNLGAEKETIIIGSDTIVYCDGEIMGKPKDEEDAFATLKKLSGHTHQVYTGVTLIRISKGKTPINEGVESSSETAFIINSAAGNQITAETFYERTDVTFYDVTDQEIRDYIATGHPMDKAGSYGLQGLGAFLVKKIDGDYFTVIGLPIAHLLRVLKNQ